MKSHIEKMQIAAVKHARTNIVPTHSVVIDLKKSRSLKDAVVESVSIDSVIAENTFHSFRIALSKRCYSKPYLLTHRRYSKSYYRRHKPLIAACCSVERSKDNRYHLHVLLRKPDHMTEHCFRFAVNATAHKNKFIETNRKYAVHITAFDDTTEDHIRNTMFYNFKSINRTDQYIVL